MAAPAPPHVRSAVCWVCVSSLKVFQNLTSQQKIDLKIIFFGAADIFFIDLLLRFKFVQLLALSDASLGGRIFSYILVIQCYDWDESDPSHIM